MEEEEDSWMPGRILDTHRTLGETSSDTEQPDGHINDLPLEILIQIFSHLDPVQLSELRAVCKKWRAVIQGRDVWLNSFSQKFGTRKQFASLMCTKYWITEYFSRLRLYKQWRKNTATRKFFVVVTGSFCYVDKCLVDFSQNRVLVYSRPTGDITTYTLSTGKNQTYIPSSSLTVSTCSYDVTWGHHLFAKSSGELYVRNLFTATSSTARSSVIELRGASNSWITSCKLNPQYGKQREFFDCIAASTSGHVQFWRSNALSSDIDLKQYLYTVDTDFKRFVMAISKTSVFIISYPSLEYVEVDLEITYNESISIFMDVDYGGQNIVVCHGQYIRNIHYSNLDNIKVKKLDLEVGTFIEKARIQTGRENLLSTKDSKIVGGDALLYANILSDSSVIVWDVRDPEKDIKPYFRISATFKSQKFSIPDDLLSVTDVALNSAILIVSGYNGFANLYNSCTGKLLGECSVKLPQKLNLNTATSLIPTTNITLNHDQTQTNGLIGFGNVLQYFRFGEIEKSPYNSSKKRNVFGSSNKYAKWQSIRDGMEEYDIAQQKESERLALLQEYNGSIDGLDEDLQLTLALSESCASQPANGSSDSDFELALNLSASEHPQPQDSGDTSELFEETAEEKELREALRLSLIEQ